MESEMSDASGSPDTHYVLLIHGTWSDSPGWHKFDESGAENFCSALRKHLNEHGLIGALERRPEPAFDTSFTWSGANSHEDRISAGLALATHIRRITELDETARIHVVAHSHGCNVTLKALEFYLADVDRKAWQDISREHRSRRPGDLEAPDGLESFRAWRRVEVLRRSGKYNRVGRVIFLGPPFLQKVWSRRSMLTHALIKIGDTSIGALMGVSVIYLASLFLWAVLWLPFYLAYLASDWAVLRSPSLNPLEWNFWLLAISGILAVFAGLLGGAIGSNASSRINRNVYFDSSRFRNGSMAHVVPPSHQSSAADREAKRSSAGRSADTAAGASRPKSVATPQALPFNCLTVTSELFDEVFLGFSLEPIVYGLLVPQLQDFFRPRFSLALPRIPLGHGPGIIDSIARMMYVVRRNLVAVFWWIASPISGLWKRRIARNLLRLLASAAFGIPLFELRNSIIKASSRINEPMFFREYIWDVTRLLASRADTRIQSDRAQRYSFLWNPDDLASRRAKSQIWTRVAAQNAQINSYLGKFLEKPIEEDALAKTSIMLEERGKEAIGAAGLAHLAYHSDETIVRAVADFIAIGRYPAPVNEGQREL